MRKTVLLCLLLLCGIAPVTFARAGAHSPSHSASSSAGSHSGRRRSGDHTPKKHSSKSRSSGGHSTGKHSSSRLGGTTRRSRGSHASTKRKTGHAQSHQRTASVARDSGGKIKRSEHARAEFQRAYPCPSTGQTSGACPGYVVDHIVPLKRGGADNALNMQWQAKDAAKAKDEWE